MKRFGRIALVMLLVLAVASPALAMKGGESRQGRPFNDIVGTWAEFQITKMYGLGIVNGVGDSEFDPEGNLTRAQIAVLFCRALGLDGEVAGLGQIRGRAFGDEEEIPAWAKAHVRVCYQARLLLGELRSLGRVFNPMKPITRQEFVVLLVRAADMEDEAAALVNTPEELAEVRAALTEQFKDGKLIGNWALGSIALAMDEGWIDCLIGRQVFQPNKPVTRAEAVCMLEAAEVEIGEMWTNRYAGVITAVDADEITIDPGARTFDINPGCVVRIDGEAAEVADLEVGFFVKLYTNEDGVICIEARTEAEEDEEEEEEEVEEELTGEITDVNVPERKVMFNVDGDSPDGGAVEYAVSAGVVIKDGTTVLPWDGDLEAYLAGKTVEIKLIDDVVVKITVED